MGLVSLVLQSWQQWTLRHLPETYCTLSLSSVATTVGLPSALHAELLILR